MIRNTILILFAIACHDAACDDTPLFQQMTESGIAISDDQSCIVTKPALSSEQDVATRREILDRLAGGRGWKSFSRKSFAAPVAIDVKYVKDAGGERIGHQVDVAFIVHAPLAKLKNEELMEQLFGKLDDSEEKEDFAAEELTPRQLRSVGIGSIDENESYGEIQLSVLKRVMVRGVARTQKVVGDDELTIAWEIDPRFGSDAAGRNTWSPIERDRSGQKIEGAKRPYRGAGGYVRASDLPEIENACLVELHIVMHEPQAWFRGSHVLRSKFPILMQENARNLRRKLMNR